MRPFATLDNALQALAAPAAGIFLLLALCVAAPAPRAHGVRLELLRVGQRECGDGRPEVIHWEPDGSVWLNEQNVGAQRMAAVVAKIMETRAERAVYLAPGREATVQQVADLTAALNSAADGLHIGIATHRQIEAMTYTEFGWTITPVGCMDWPPLRTASSNADQTQQ